MAGAQKRRRGAQRETTHPEVLLLKVIVDVCRGEPKWPLQGARGAAAPRPAQTGGRQLLPRIVGAQLGPNGVQARLFCKPVDELGIRVPRCLHRLRLWLSSAGHQRGFHGAGYLFRTHPAPQVLRARGEGTLAGSRVNAVPSDSTLRVTVRMSRGLVVLDTAGHRLVSHRPPTPTRTSSLAG